MSGPEHAEEISDDYRYSLESLQTPDKFAINNLTVIAKENTDCADAIANVLTEHIRKVSDFLLASSSLDRHKGNIWLASFNIKQQQPA